MPERDSSLNLLREMASRLPQVVFLADLRPGRLLYANPSITNVFGVSPQQLIADQQLWQTVVVVEDHDRVVDEMAKVAQGPVQLEFRFLHPGGGERVGGLRAWPILGDNGQFERLVGIAEDVTEERKATHRSSSLSASLRQLIANLPDGIIVYRDEVLYCNETLLKHYGLTQSIVGQPITAVIDRLFVPEQQHLAYMRLREAATGNVLRPVERRLRTSDDSVRIAELTTLTIDFDGAPARVTLVRDKTEQRALQAQLASTDRLSMLGRVAAGLTHALNNPLAVLLGQLELSSEQFQELDDALVDLRRQGGKAEWGAEWGPERGPERGPEWGPEWAAERLDRAQASLQRLREYTLEAARSANHVRGVMADFRSLVLPGWREPHPVDLSAVLTSAVRLAASQLHEHAQLTMTLGPAPQVMADEARLCQALAYLLVAAAIAIEHLHGPMVRLTLSVDAARGRARLRLVALDGVRLGDMLWPATDAALAGPMGACATVISSYGGGLEAQEVDGNSALVVWLPAAREARPRPPSAPPLRPGERGQVLVIDDDPSVAAILQRILVVDHDVSIEGAPGVALQRLLGGESFDAIVCDVMMPEISGLELYETLLRDRPDQASRVVFVTGGAYADHADWRLERTGRPLLDKPFDIRAIRVQIGDIVAENRRADGAHTCRASPGRDPH